MRFKLMAFFCLVMFWASMAAAAPRQCVLADHFTSSTCGPCATYNPGLHSVLNSMTRDTVVKISWHVWWPSIGDPFYAWNPSEVAVRVNYFNVSGVPDIYIDGTLSPSMADPAAIRSAIRQRAAITSPCSMALWATPETATTIHYLVRVTADQNMNNGNYRLYCALISDVINWNGQNGETSFPDPFRDVSPNASPGQAFSILSGQSYEIEGLLNRDAAWDISNLSIVGFVQNNATREVAQAEWADPAASVGSITVLTPNTADTVWTGEMQSITWNSANFGEAVRIQIKREYPASEWETLFASTSNDGSEPWTVTGPAAANARIRVTGTAHPLVGDTTSVSFPIGLRALAVTSPNGHETFLSLLMNEIRWTSTGVPGNVSIELRRSTGGTWETIDPSTSNDGSYWWMATWPVTTHATIRITSLSMPFMTDQSDAEFTIADPPNLPPNIANDPLQDQLPGPATVTAIITDEFEILGAWLAYRHASGGAYDSLPMVANANPGEYDAVINNLTAGQYEYYLRAVDAYLATATSPVRSFDVGIPGNTVLSYDDGSAEASQWSHDMDIQWAVRFDPPQVPFVLAGARIGISALFPDSWHYSLGIEVRNVDGSGYPGSVVLAGTSGSIGNVIGGVPTGVDNFTRVLFRDGLGEAPVINSPFFLVVSNPELGTYDAFLHDTSSVRQGRSYVYDPCTEQWYNETSGCDLCRPGNRMIRATGYPLIAPVITVNRSGQDIRLRWNSTQAPYYHIWSASSVLGPFNNFEGAATDTTFLDTGALSQGPRFYRVHSSTAP